MNASDSFRTAVAILWVGIAYGQTPPAYPPSTPFLRIETGMHTAIIRAIDVDAAERFLVTASDDKTARVWDLHDGKLLQILRPPQGDGRVGRSLQWLFHPTGTTVAVGGVTGPAAGPFSVYLFDRGSGKLIRSILGFPDLITHLSYSFDGRYLAIALGTNSGIRVYHTFDISEVVHDTDYGDDCYWAEFDRRGRLATASLDGFVRLYDENFHLIAKKAAPVESEPYSARFSPDGSQIAIGFGDTTSVNVLSGRDLSFLYAAQTPVGDGDLARSLGRAMGERFTPPDVGGARLAWTNSCRGKAEMRSRLTVPYRKHTHEHPFPIYRRNWGRICRPVCWRFGRWWWTRLAAPARNSRPSYPRRKVRPLLRQRRCRNRILHARLLPWRAPAPGPLRPCAQTSII